MSDVSFIIVVGALLFLNARLKYLLGCQNSTNPLKNDLFLGFLSKKEMISLNAASHLVSFSGTINSYARDLKMAVYLDVFCKVDLKFSTDRKCFSLLAVLCFIASSP